MNADLHDLQLVDLALAGDSPAFDLLVRRYRGGVMGLSLGLLRDEIEAQDIVQETFLAAYHKLPSFSRSSPFRAWLYRIATNACLMRLRTRRRRPELPLTLQGSPGEPERERPVPDPSPGAEQRLQDWELGRRIRAGVSGLPESYREVLILADYHHLPMKDIAERLDLTVPNVKTRLHRARLAVRASLEPYLEGKT